MAYDTTGNGTDRLLEVIYRIFTGGAELTGDVLQPSIKDQIIQSVVPLHIGQFIFSWVETKEGILGYGEAGCWDQIQPAGTLPRDICWKGWLKLVQQLLSNGVTNPQNINRRYLFGELRLSRLNKIYAFMYGSVLRGYQFTYQTYGELFGDYLTPLTAAIIYVALVLTAMQVGLVTIRLNESLSFQNASYGFTIFQLLGR